MLKLHAESIVKAALALTITSLLAACGGGGGGGGGSAIPSGNGSGGGGGNPTPAPQQHTPPPNLSQTRIGVAVFGDDSNGPGELQIASLFGGSGQPVSAKVSTLPLPFMFDLEDIAVSPDWSYMLVADGARTLRVVSGFANGSPSVSTYTLDVSPWGNDMDALRMLQNGDEAVLSLDTNNKLLHVSGLRSGKPVAAELIDTPDLRNGLVLSADNKVLLARGYSGLTAYSVNSVTPSQGALGGWVYHSFTQTANLTNVPALESADARAGVAISPTDSTRAVVVGGGPAIVEITGLPGKAAAQSVVPITGVRTPFSVAISSDGTTAFVATDSAIAVFSGVNTGTLQQIQTYTVPVAKDSLAEIATLGVTSDGKYLVAIGHLASKVTSATGDLVVLPISPSGLGAPVTTVPGVVVPGNDQILVQ